MDKNIFSLQIFFLFFLLLLLSVLLNSDFISYEPGPGDIFSVLLKFFNLFSELKKPFYVDIGEFIDSHRDGYGIRYFPDGSIRLLKYENGKKIDSYDPDF